MERPQILLMCFSISVLFLAVFADDDLDENSKLAIYYGDQKVKVGDPFSVTCIIPISDPIQWYKDGETIKKHNLRHGKDAHAFIESEHPIEGESHKIEAKIKVNSALEIHEGKYQCNLLHSNSYHYLRVEENKRAHKPRDDFTKLPNFTTAVGLPLSSDEIEETFRGNVFENNKNMYSFEMNHLHNTSKQVLDELNRSKNSVKGAGLKKHQISSEENFQITSEITNLNSKLKIEPTTKTFVKPPLLVPNYDNKELQLKVFEIKYNLVLSCNITREGDYELKWAQNGTEVSKVPSLKGRYQILQAERKLIITKAEEKDAGIYSCYVDKDGVKEKSNINVIANVAVRVPSNIGVVEGEKLTITCNVLGTDPQIWWEYTSSEGENITIYNSTEKYILKEDETKIPNTILTVENISLEDRGKYECKAKNMAFENVKKFGFASDTCFVRIKGKLAALWPFLGICAEVFILCAIILIYERRRNKSELEESDTDPNTEQKKKRRNYK